AQRLDLHTAQQPGDHHRPARPGAQTGCTQTEADSGRTLNMRALLCWLLLVSALPVQAEVYTYIDADGNRVFTDRPGNAPAERMQLKAPNSMSAEPVQSSRRLSPDPEPSPRYDQLRILTPEPDATLRNTGDLLVTVTSEPALMDGHS